MSDQIPASEAPAAAAPETSNVSTLGMLAGLDPGSYAGEKAASEATAASVEGAQAEATDSSTPEASEAPVVAPAAQAEAEDYTEEERAVLVELLENFHKNGGQPAPVAAPEAPADAAPAQEAPAQQQAQQQGVIPQFVAQMPQAVIDAFETGDPAPMYQHVMQNQVAQQAAFVNNFNGWFKGDVVPMIGNLVETAVAAVLLTRDNPLLESVNEDVIRTVNEHRVANPNASTSEIIKGVSERLAKDELTSKALAKFKKRGGNIADLRPGATPQSPRPNARQTAPARAASGAPADANARGLGLLAGLDV